MNHQKTQAWRFTLATIFLSLSFCWTSTAQQSRQDTPPSKAKIAIPRTPPDPAVAASDSAPSTSLPVLGMGTKNFIPLWTGRRTINNSLLSQSGTGLNISGTVNAVGFTGDGSALSNVNANLLGGLPASAFAQVSAANTFTANQTFLGTLSFSGYLNSALTLQGNLTDANGEESANVIGGFAGDSTGLYPGNSVAPGVIGATIAGGGGSLFSSSLPKAPRRAEQSKRPNIGQRRPLPPPNRRGSEEQPAETQPSNFPGLTAASNSVSSNFGTVAGGAGNSILTNGYAAAVGGGVFNQASGQESVVAGGYDNFAGDTQSFVGGGYKNEATSDYSTVTGGALNQAIDVAATIGGGQSNQVNGYYGTVSGGYGNVATADATVGGGSFNGAIGFFATVPGGYSNQALGNYSFAAGSGAIANYDSSFVWSDGSAPVSDGSSNQFVALSTGGFYFYTADTGSGAMLPSGSGSWSSMSDRNVKANFAIIDGEGLLQKIATLPISTWNYKSQANSIRHMGPMAQDFRAAFGLGEDDKHISNIDSEGVALAAVQALYKLNQNKDAKIAELSQSLEQIKAEVEKLKDILAASKH